MGSLVGIFTMPPKNKLQDHSADNVGPTREKTLNQLIALKVETVSDETSTEGTNSNRISEHMPGGRAAVFRICDRIVVSCLRPASARVALQELQGMPIRNCFYVGVAFYI